ncbi:MAG: porin family protein [Beijerinckiaceae bacterium]|nr:porin family protein [Beijerinckiaceae bacterium]
MKRMRIIMSRCRIVFAAAATLLSGAAVAQDLPSYGRSQGYAASPTPQFQGLYAGGSLGLGFGEAGPNNSQGFLAGAQVGFNFTADRLVLGVEADVMLTGINAKSYTYTFTQKWLGSGRLRLGYVMNSLMIYGTGGIAGSTMSFSNFGGLSESNSLAGWVAGAGAEMFVTQNISVRGEYLYYSLGQAKFVSLSGPVFATTATNLIRVGANYKF